MARNGRTKFLDNSNTGLEAYYFRKAILTAKARSAYIRLHTRRYRIQRHYQLELGTRLDIDEAFLLKEKAFWVQINRALYNAGGVWALRRDGAT